MTNHGFLDPAGEQDAPAGQLQEEQDLEALQEDGVHREVFTGQDGPALSLEEATPGEPYSPRCRRELGHRVSSTSIRNLLAEGRIVRQDRLGGLIHEYERAAA